MWLCTEWDRHRCRRVHLNEHWYNYQWEGHSLFYLEHTTFPSIPPSQKPDRVCFMLTLFSYAGGSLSWFDPYFEFLSWKHGSGCGHKVHHPKLPEVNKKESIWYVWHFWTLIFLAFFYLVIGLFSSFQLGKTGGSCGWLVKRWIVGAKDWSVFSGLNLVLSNSDYKCFMIHFRT